LSLTVTLPVADPLFTVKRILLQQYNLATQQAFQLPRDGVGWPARSSADGIAWGQKTVSSDPANNTCGS